MAHLVMSGVWYIANNAVNAAAEANIVLRVFVAYCALAVNTLMHIKQTRKFFLKFKFIV